MGLHQINFGLWISIPQLLKVLCPCHLLPGPQILFSQSTALHHMENLEHRGCVMNRRTRIHSKHSHMDASMVMLSMWMFP